MAWRPAQDTPVAMINGRPAYPVGSKMASPPGWRGRWCWTGRVLEHAPVPYVVVGGDNGTKPKRVKPPANMQRWRKAPELVLVRSYWDYVRNVDPKGDGWVDEDDLPDAMREMILDCYQDDLTPVMRRLCKDQIAAQEVARKAKNAKARPAASAVTQRGEHQDDVGRAKAPKPKRSKR